MTVFNPHTGIGGNEGSAAAGRPESDHCVPAEHRETIVPKVSVIVPVFNVRDYLARCLNSLALQTHPNFEVVLVDDGSTDGSLELCAEFAAVDKRFTALSQPNRGVSHSRNRGLQGASGDYVMFIDADDFIEADTLEVMVSLLERSNADACVCDSFYRGGSLRYLPDSVRHSDVMNVREVLLSHLSMRFVSALWVFMFRTTAVRAISFSEDLHQMEDWDYLLRFVTRAQRLVVCHQALYHNVIREGSASFTPLSERVLSCLALPALATSCVDTSRPEVANAVNALKVRLVLKLLGMFARSGSSDSRHERSLTKYARTSLREALRNPALSTKEKAFLLLASGDPYVYALFFRAIHRIDSPRFDAASVASTKNDPGWPRRKRSSRRQRLATGHHPPS